MVPGVSSASIDASARQALPGSSTASGPSAGEAGTSKIAAARRSGSGNPVPAPYRLCVGGTRYETTQDDEFSQDTTLNMTSNAIGATPAPNGAIWSTQALGFSNGGTRNNVGSDDAYYTDASRGFGGYSPFTFANGALNITAEPVPAQYASAAQLDGAHWLSGVLEGPAQLYGYVEVSAKEPNLQGFWPAPLWLLGYRGDDGQGNGYEELDVNELFGNSLGRSVVQQTQIFNLSGNPPANFVRSTVSPDPSTSYHTYGVLWTPGTVQYYIDRKPTSPAFPNAANGPANPIIVLQVFAANTWAPAPAAQTPQTMSLQYYRWYQSENVGCSPTVIVNSAPSPSPSPSAVPSATPSPAPTSTAHPTATPVPTPTPTGKAPGAPSVVQDTGVTSYGTSSTLSAAFAHAPASGDELIAFVNAATPITTPAGWTQRDGPGNAGFFIYSAIVGSAGVPAATAYAFGANMGDIELLDVTGASQTAPVLAGSDPIQWQAQFPRSLAIPQAGGLLLTAWGGYSYASNGFQQINEALPTGQTERALSYTLNTAIASGGAVSLRVSQITSEPFAASAPFTMIGTIAVSSEWNINGDLVWIPPM